MTRDKALAVFDALVLRGYHAQLEVFHGVTAAHQPRHEPIYSVTSGARDYDGFTLDDMHALATICDENGVKPHLFVRHDMVGVNFRL